MFKILTIILLLSYAVFASDDIFLGEDHAHGFIDLDNGGDDMFYWLFRSRKNKNKDPLILWLSGGPGLSGEITLFTANGPFGINKDIILESNPYSWNNASNLLYIDQPIGTGFSKISDPSHYATTQLDIVKNLYKFITKFLEKYPEFKSRDFYMAGESYAGHYIPAAGAYFLQQNNSDINLKGVSIANGVVDLYSTVPTWAEYARENGLIGTFHYYLAKIGFAQCQILLKLGMNNVAYYQCGFMYQGIIGLIKAAFNPFDIRMKVCEGSELCFDYGFIYRFFLRENVRKELDLGDRVWLGSSAEVEEHLFNDLFVTMIPDVEYLLSRNISLLVLNGDNDFVCNWMADEAWISLTKWEGKENYAKKQFQTLVMNGKNVGQIKQYDKITAIRVSDAGHFIGMDRPDVSLEIMKTFLLSKTVISTEKSFVLEGLNKEEF